MSRAQDVTRLLGGRWHGSNGMACCPAHEDRTPSLSIADRGDGRLLLHYFAGCAYQDVQAALERLGISTKRNGFVQVGQVIKHQPFGGSFGHSDKSPLNNQEKARRVWEDALPLGGTAAERYLRNRGIACDLPSTLRYVRDCWHREGRFPALIGKIEGSPGFAVHRTYLDIYRPTKAKISPAKMMLGPAAGGAINIAKAHTSRLVVAEGIETALSLYSGIYKKPATILAALSASNMTNLKLPSKPGELVIASDGDRPGKEAAHKLAKRAALTGWRVKMLPAPDGLDWNDVLLGREAAL